MFFGTIWLFFVCFYTTYWCIYYYNDYMSINGDARQWYWNKMTVTYYTIFWFHNIHINFARSQALLHVCKIFSFKLPVVFFSWWFGAMINLQKDWSWHLASQLFTNRLHIFIFSIHVYLHVIQKVLLKV